MKEKRYNGLSFEQVEASRAAHGRNVVTPPAGEPVWKLLLDKFRDPIIRILLVAALLSLVVVAVDEHASITESLGIFCAIFLATGVGFWFEYDAKRRFERLNRVGDEQAVKVRREGSVMQIPKRDVVVGDLVYLESGETVPADGKLIEAVSLRVNESTLTGELETAKSTDETRFDEDATYPSDMLLGGTTVVDGYGMMVVTAVGDATEFGRVARQATIVTDEKTPLSLQLERLSRMIGRWGVLLSVLIFAVLLVKGMVWGDILTEGWAHAVNRILQIFMVAVAMIAMAVPEGLPMSITLSLAMSMRRMLRTNNLVRKLHACETMGAATVICTDKTGTLTCNRMRVERMVHYADLSQAQWGEMVAANTTAFLDAAGSVIGNPTEGALLEWLQREGMDYVSLREGAPIVDRLTFTTERKYMATIVQSGVRGERMLYVKGAPEIVRTMCRPDGREQAVAADLRSFQDRAMRTLAFACAPTEAADCMEAIAGGELLFAGVAAIDDPVREEVPEAVGRCLAAGISVKIVTGDTPGTAREIARRIGLWNDELDNERNHMSGAEFAAASDQELLERVGELKILSRARPLDKQRLVQLLQQQGEVVAVTGDGTNDAPALNFADVGLSMGTGTSVAKDASDITLLDDSFNSIATAVMWGRSLYENIQRFVMFQLTINFAAILVLFFGALFGTEMPLTVVQILWVNLIMDTFAALALASLPPRPEVMFRAPRRAQDFIITRAMMRNILGYGLLFLVVLLAMLLRWERNGGPDIYQLTLFFTVFVFLQFWNMFNAKAFGVEDSAFRHLGRARIFLFVLVLILAGQWLIVEVGDGVFRTVPLHWRDWLLAAGATSFVLWIGEVLRFAARRARRRK